MNWQLIYFPRGEDGRGRKIAVAPLDRLLAGDGPVLNEIANGDKEIAEAVLSDLDRVGARYAEFVGGTVVLVAIDND